MTTGLDQLDAAVARMAQNLEDCQQEEYRREQEEYRTLWAQIAEVLHQLTREEKEKALAVVTHPQEETMAQQRGDPIETCEENSEEEDTAGIQEVIPDTQVGDSIEGQNQEKRSLWIRIASWELRFSLTGSCLGSQESPGFAWLEQRKGGTTSSGQDCTNAPPLPD